MKTVNNLTLSVEVTPGSDVFEAMDSMKLLADKTGTMVKTNMNGVTVMVKPNADMSDYRKRFLAEAQRDTRYRILCFHPSG